MKELNDIIAAYDKAVLQNKRTALVTVVNVEGSSYRRPGARMLITEEGDITGAISGGCLEGDALRKAQFAMFQQQNKLEIYDTTDEDNKLGVQLGCNGIVFILFEPIQCEDSNNPIYLIKKMMANRSDAVLLTCFDANKNALQKGTCGFVSGEEIFFAADSSQDIKADCHHVLADKSSLVKQYENSCTVLYQFVPPSMQLVIVGAGNDAQPLANMGAFLGWTIIVADGRPAYVTPQRFPAADKLYVIKPPQILSVIEIDEQTAVVLMTHNYNYDLAVLEQLMQTNCRYTGVLGPKKKLCKMLDELNRKGIVVDEVARQHMYGPVGLDMGAETAEEIALSIIAEIKIVFADKQGNSLKEKATLIHERPILLQHD